ncbi:MAG: hypothetical protein WC600_17130 [Desulfobaccales bacterium]
MKWFEHQTSAHQNKKIRKIEVFYKDRGGQAVMAAVGRFWRLHEIVGNQGLDDAGLDTYALPEGYGLEVLADDLYCSKDELCEFLELLAKINSIDPEAWSEARTVFLPKLAERADTYTKRLNQKREREKSREDSGQYGQKVRTGLEECSKSVRTGLEECSPPQVQVQTQKETTPLPPANGGNGAGDFLKWFEAYPAERRKDRMRVEKVWRRLKQGGKLPPLPEMLQVLALQIQSAEWGKEEGRFIPLPHRYLELGRFVDASVTGGRESPEVCLACRGSGYRRAKEGEDGIDGVVRCECKLPDGVRGP